MGSGIVLAADKLLPSRGAKFGLPAARVAGRKRREETSSQEILLTLDDKSMVELESKAVELMTQVNHHIIIDTYAPETLVSFMLLRQMRYNPT